MWSPRVLLATAAILLFGSNGVVAQSGSTTIGGLSGSHTNIPRWCGKPYEKGSPNFNPGGMLSAPKPTSTPNLFVQLEPQHSIYDSSESTAAFLVSSSISYTHGQTFGNPKDSSPFTMLAFDIRNQGDDTPLVSNTVPVGSVNNIFSFSLSKLKPRLEPYNIILYGTSASGQKGSKTFTASTTFYYLPAKHSGSTVKVDNLNGGLIVANKYTNYAFEPLMPFGFYTSCGSYLNYSLSNVQEYKDLGFTAINPVCAFTDGPLGFLLNWLDETNLWFQYDMRGSYLNLTSVSEQIPKVKNHSAFLTWYTADEPDGWQYALNSTRLAYDLLKKEDPYHPVALVLNCDNYHFEQYSSGADYLMEDAYPIGINATWSQPFNVPCNETYGDCGCDDCVGELQDVSNRLNTLSQYQTWLGQEQKPIWAVLQAFSGEGYWSRDPTPAETWAMMVLSFNHAAKGIMSWLFPPSAALKKAHSMFARVATVNPTASFLLGGQPTPVKVPGMRLLDVAYWEVGNQVMVGVVNLDYSATQKVIEIPLYANASQVASQPWGSVDWSVANTTKNTSVLTTNGLAGLATSFVILDLETP